MIQINHVDIKSIAEKHYQAVKPYVKVRLEWSVRLLEALRDKDVREWNTLFNRKYEEFNSLKIDSKRPLAEKLLSLGKTKKIEEADTNIIFSRFCEKLYVTLIEIRDSLEVLLKGEPSESKKKSDDIEKKLCLPKEFLETVFNYKNLTEDGFEEENGERWTNYTLTEALQAKTCFYCNRHCTHTIRNQKGKKKGSPTLDHFFDKGTFPLLRLNFYNLIPSCYTCNSICKGGKEFRLDKNIHPHLEGFENNVKFKWQPKDVSAAQGFSANNIILLHYPEGISNERKIKIENNIDTFGLKDAYNTHTDIVQELILKKQKYPDNYIAVISTFFDGNLSKEEAYRLAFGNYLDEKDHHKRPLSKLTKDIAEDLGLI